MSLYSSGTGLIAELSSQCHRTDAGTETSQPVLEFTVCIYSKYSHMAIVHIFMPAMISG